MGSGGIGLAWMGPKPPIMLPTMSGTVCSGLKNMSVIPPATSPTTLPAELMPSPTQLMASPTMGMPTLSMASPTMSMAPPTKSATPPITSPIRTSCPR